MPHEQVPPQDWEEMWDKMVAQEWARRNSPHLLERGFSYPMTAGGFGAYGVLRGMDVLGRWLVNRHLATYPQGPKQNPYQGVTGGR